MSTKLIALDAGHGLGTAGKRTPNGVHEWELNDKVRDFVVEMLKDYNCKFIFPDNNEGKTDESLTSRRKMYVNAKADVAVSIHHNATSDEWVSQAIGVEVWIDKNYTKADKKLAECIQKRLPGYTGLKDRGIREANWTVINQNTVPACLCEGGFMNSRLDYKVITSTEGQKAYARAVAEGLIEFLDLKKKTATTTSTATSTKTNTSTSTNKSSVNTKVLAWQKAAIADGFKFPKYGADGEWGSECEAVAKEAIVKKRTTKKDGKTVAVYKYPNLTKIVQKKVGLTGKDVDGKCGATTHKAIVAYQKKNGLVADGCVGLKSWKKVLGI